MKIRTHMAVSVDGFVATPDGRPAILTVPDFNPAVSHGFPTAEAGGRDRGSQRARPRTRRPCSPPANSGERRFRCRARTLRSNK
jgi:hypothetical protein